jgi:hypothetical protein
MKLNILAVFLLTLISVAYSSRYSFDYGDNGRRCKQTSKQCSFTLIVDNCYAMRHPKYIVYSNNRNLFGINGSRDDVPLKTDDVVTTIGYYNQMLICINGTFPGPNIVVYQNQIVRIKVVNNMVTEAFTLHFHGFVQRGTPHMDGVEFITQKPIPPHSNYEYVFTATDSGIYIILYCLNFTKNPRSFLQN